MNDMAAQGAWFHGGFQRPLQLNCHSSRFRLHHRVLYEGTLRRAFRNAKTASS